VHQLRLQLDQIERVVMDTHGEANTTGQTMGVQKSEPQQAPITASSGVQMGDLVSTLNAGEVQTVLTVIILPLRQVFFRN
jgi:hypothetical protein